MANVDELAFIIKTATILLQPFIHISFPLECEGKFYFICKVGPLFNCAQPQHPPSAFLPIIIAIFAIDLITYSGQSFLKERFRKEVLTTPMLQAVIGYVFTRT